MKMLEEGVPAAQYYVLHVGLQNRCAALPFVTTLWQHFNSFFLLKQKTNITNDFCDLYGSATI